MNSIGVSPLESTQSTPDAVAPPYAVGFCGTGRYSVQCAQALQEHPDFSVSWVVTPAPKPVGRHREMTASPLDQWARRQGAIVTYPVEGKLASLQPDLEAAAPIDFLVVVSFGYLLPKWLLKLPRVAPVNVHPSALPRYRGSAPGQFALLYGETQSAVSIMEMNTKFDQGAVIAQLPFALSPLETQKSYYDQAFQLAGQELPHILAKYARDPQATPQPAPPLDSPLARRLQRDDGFIPHSWWLAALAGRPTFPETSPHSPPAGPVLQDLLQAQPYLTPAQLIDRAVRALHPWPGIWTIVPKHKGRSQVRLKILSGIMQTARYSPTQWQYEGEAAQTA